MRLLRITLFLIVTSANAATFTGASLEFDSLQIGEQVLNYYAGGFGDLGSGPGPAFGVRFTEGLRADDTQIAFGPSAQISGTPLTMNLDAPWNDSISFYFEGGGNVEFYSGPDASGSVVAAYELRSGFPFGETPGVFQSVVFLNAAGTRLDSITFGAMVIPEPSSLPVLAIALLAGTLLKVRQKSRCSRSLWN